MTGAYSIPEGRIELAGRSGASAKCRCRQELIGLLLTEAGIPHLSAGVRSGSKALSYIGLARGSTPPIPRRSPNHSARTRRNPRQPARSDGRSLILNNLLDQSALADCGLSVCRQSACNRGRMPPCFETSVLVDIYRRNGTSADAGRPFWIATTIHAGR